MEAPSSKPRSLSLENEGVRFIQVRINALMSKRKERHRRSQPLPQERGSQSPSRVSISRKLTSFLGDSVRRSSVEEESTDIQSSWADERCYSSSVPLPGKSYKRSGLSSPLSPPGTLPYQHRRIVPLPSQNASIEEKEPLFALPPGTKKRTPSGGVTHTKGGVLYSGEQPGALSLGFYGDYARVNLAALDKDEEESESKDEESECLIPLIDEDDKHEKGQLSRRHSSADNNRTRHGSGGSFGHTYLRGEDPNQAAILFRDCRGLPAAAPFLENIRRSELEEDESQIIVKFFKYHNTYDLIPTSAKLVIFDTRLQVKKAFYALVYNGVRAAPLWDAEKQKFVGMLTITDFIRILQSFYSSSHRKMDELEEHRLEMWRTLLNDDVRNLISITPNECLYDAIRSLIHHKIHRLPVIDPFTGNVLYIITHKRILKFLFLYINELPKPSILQKSLRELNIGTYDKIETARGSTLIIEALNKFVERRISALPIVDDEGKLIDIYAKFDVINLAAEGTYHNLDVTLHQANEYRNEWFEGVLKCNLDETLGIVMERIVRAEVHRLVVVDKNNKVIGIISLSDILNELVLKPCSDDPESLKGRTVAQMEATLDRDGSQKSECSVSGEDLPRDNSQTLDLGKTESEDSVGETWSPGGGRDSEKNQDGKSSSIESMEQEKFEIDINKMPDNITKQEVLSISG